MKSKPSVKISGKTMQKLMDKLKKSKEGKKMMKDSRKTAYDEVLK